MAFALTLAAAPAWGHDPFDGGTEMFVYADRVELNVTLGADATLAYLKAAGVPPQLRNQIRHPAMDTAWVELPAALAPRLVAISGEGQVLQATRFAASPNEIEGVFRIVYPRPGAARVELRAAYFDGIADMRPGTVAVANAEHRLIVSTLVSPAQPAVTVPLSGSAAATAGRASFASVLRLGVPLLLGVSVAALLLLWRRRRSDSHGRDTQIGLS